MRTRAITRLQFAELLKLLVEQRKRERGGGEEGMGKREDEGRRIWRHFCFLFPVSPFLLRFSTENQYNAKKIDEEERSELNGGRKEWERRVCWRTEEGGDRGTKRVIGYFLLKHSEQRD